MPHSTARCLLPWTSQQRSGHVDIVQQLLKWDEKLVLAKTGCGFTPLHCAAWFGHREVADLLSNNLAALMARDLDGNRPSQIACCKGHLSVLQILIQKEAFKNSDFQERSNHLHIAAFYGHVAIVKFIVSSTNGNGNIKSINGKTPLDNAIENKFQSVARELLKHPDWMNLLVSPGPTPLLTSARDTPMRRLIKTFPELATEVFDKCILRSDDAECCFYDFRYLDDTWMVISDDGKELIHDKNPYEKYGDLLPNTRPYSENTEVIYDNHPLRLLVNSNCEYLLTHQLVRRLLNHKWNTLGKYFYISSLIMYLLFLFFFSSYVMNTSAPYNVVDENMTSIDISKVDGACDHIKHRPSSFFVICAWLVLILAVVHLLKELVQFYMRPQSYFIIENLVEIFIYISAIFVALDWMNDCATRTGIRQSWQWYLAAVSAFLQWMSLVLFVRKLPSFGIYVMMLFDIVKTFFSVFFIFALFVFAFSITFCIIFQNRPEFSTLYSSVLKTIVMMIGEFEFTGIFHGDANIHEERTYMNNIARLLFIFFIFLVTILLMNMLTGLAVDDIKSIQEKSEIKQLAMQVDLVLNIESMLPFVLLKRMAKGRVADYKNRSGWWRRLRGRIGFDETIVEEINVPIRDPAVMESERRFEQQQTAQESLLSNVDQLNKNQLKMANKQQQMEEKQQQISDNLLQIADTLDTILKAVQKEGCEPPGALSAHSSRT